MGMKSYLDFGENNGWWKQKPAECPILVPDENTLNVWNLRKMCFIQL
jgi:hypothetical protein